MDRGAWWAPVHGVAKSQTRLSNFYFHFLARRKTSEQAVFVIQERDIGGPDEGRGAEGSEWIGELIGGRLGACGNWLSDGSELSQEFWLFHLVSGQDCPGCSSGGESCSRIIVCVARSGPLVYGCPRSIIQDYAQLHGKDNAVPQTDKALYSCGLKILVVRSPELLMGLISQNHWGLRVLGCCSVILMTVPLILMLSGWQLELQPVHLHSRQEEGEMDAG